MSVKWYHDLRHMRLSGLGALAALMLAPGAALAAPPGTMPFGVYDPYGDFADDPDVAIEHLFLPWEDVFLPSLQDADEYALERGRAVLVTIEPWTWTRSERNTPQNLMEGLLSGRYDLNMRTICEELNRFSSPVTIRWGHEMEDESGQFIWANWYPETYIAAYRRMVDLCRGVTDKFDYMWSPLGFEDLADYYPGDDYVDVVGVSVFGYEPWEQAVLGSPRDYLDIFTPRYERASAFGKPVVVAEIGYSGSAGYVDQWENMIRQIYEQFPALRAVIYFNQKEVYPWPDGFGLPDWRVRDRVIDE